MSSMFCLDFYRMPTARINIYVYIFIYTYVYIKYHRFCPERSNTDKVKVLPILNDNTHSPTIPNDNEASCEFCFPHASSDAFQQSTANINIHTNTATHTHKQRATETVAILECYGTLARVLTTCLVPRN